jgi:hypothetical protein
VTDDRSTGEARRPDRSVESIGVHQRHPESTSLTAIVIMWWSPR